MSHLNVEAALEVLEELISDQGEVVFSTSWEATGPGYGGSHQIYKLGGYYFLRLDDSPYQGPYNDLDTALEALENPFAVDSITESISCTEYSTDQIAEWLTWWPSDSDPTDEDFEHRFSLNGEPWVCRVKGGEASFSRVEDVSD